MKVKGQTAVKVIHLPYIMHIPNINCNPIFMIYADIYEKGPVSIFKNHCLFLWCKMRGQIILLISVVIRLGNIPGGAEQPTSILFIAW